jgi:hypothetical protein
MSDDIRRALPPFPPEKTALAHNSSTNNLKQRSEVDGE